ncbi:phage gp6-like head-tail connector protein [Streptomyces lunaelactis]|uniref:phage gp6-like head-tail connector protein n=1 Tax=Streptomyces lunaelactis TaxID=1535768 RepID=UPI00158523F0|nr:phage gp6-like head-tail connector protein [Streptomyces lunaelactis]NUL03597.1 phage gp6-like head-tail connector protein [Streptomyces lunaelactis]
MAHEYADRAALKESLNIEVADDTRDDLLDRALASASRGIDTACGRRFWLDSAPAARTFRLSGRVVCSEEGERALVDDIGAAPTLVETGTAGSWVTHTNYEAGPDNALLRGRPITSLLQPSGSWGTGVRLRVTAKWGWPAVPDEIVQATLIQASRLYKRKDSPEGVTGSAEWGVVRLSRRDPDVWALIEHYVLPGFG